MRARSLPSTVGARDGGRRDAGDRSVAGASRRRARAPSTPAAAIDPALGIFNLDHVIFIVQENRSFDHYFGTFPGADGIPTARVPPRSEASTGAPARITTRTSSTREARTTSAPRGSRSTRGRWTARSVALRVIGNACRVNPARPGCRQAMPGPNGTPDVMGYHTADEIPNYWAYAQRYTLQDRMFAPSDSWTLARAPVPGVGMVRDVSQLRPDAVPLRPEVPRIQRGRRREVLGARRRQATTVRLGGYHVAAPQRRRELGVLRRAGQLHQAARAASRPKRARTRS